jgi:hypothetical protein
MKNYSRIGEELTIANVGKDGRSVQLSDGSKWTIKIGDTTKTICWYATQRIVVERNENETFPYALTNLDTAGPDQVEAK